MTDQLVYIGWGPMMASCYISLMEGEKYGPTLQISEGLDTINPKKITSVVPQLAKLDGQKLPIAQLSSYLPQKENIAWEEELKGDRFIGYEMRGKGQGFNTYVSLKDGGKSTELNQEQRQELLKELLTVRDMFFG